MIANQQTQASRPAGVVNGGDPILSGLLRSDLYRNYHHAFEAAVGLPLDLKRPDSFHFPLDGSRHQNRFCMLMAARNRSCASCLQFQQRLHDQATEEPTTVECMMGLSESAVPIRAGDRVIALLRTGQVFLDPPAVSRLHAALPVLGLDLGSTEARQLETAYVETRGLPQPRYAAVLSMLRIFAQHLETLANQLLVEQSSAELPAITKARSFIEENYAEQIRLDDAAHAANMSAFYFCKLFSQVVGLSFTQYLARLRVEVVKQKLLNSDTSVCDAAYAAGFQSLSQFNRVFRRVTGETPSAYRIRVHGSLPRCRRM